MCVRVGVCVCVAAGKGDTREGGWGLAEGPRAGLRAERRTKEGATGGARGVGSGEGRAGGGGGGGSKELTSILDASSPFLSHRSLSSFL